MPGRFEKLHCYNTIIAITKKTNPINDILAEYSLQHLHGSVDYDVISDVLHGVCRFSRHKRDDHRLLVHGPEEEELAPGRGCPGNVTEQMSVRVPERLVEAQYDLLCKYNMYVIFDVKINKFYYLS